MVKKRLSDFLRNEAQKSLEPKVESTPSSSETTLSSTGDRNEAEKSLEPEVESASSSPETVLSSTGGDVERSPGADAIEVSAQALEEPWSDAVEVDAVEVDAVETIASTSSLPKSNSHPTKADLQAMVTTLRAELEATQQQEQHFKQQIASLEANLQGQKTLVQQLQKEQEQSQQVKAELEQAKQMILKLSSANSEITKTAPQPPTPTAPPQPQVERRLQLSPLPKRPAEIKPTFYPKMPSESDTRLSDMDIGWVD
jgi:DNA repair exonuclease SbcCD ATPase subunit